MAILNPTIACADILHLSSDIEELIAGGAKMLHIDIMDGHYVPNICLSFGQAQAIRRSFPDIPMDVHLMVTDPFRWLNNLEALKPRMAAFHIDATPFPMRMIKSLKGLGIRAGAALNPAQPVSMLEEIAGELDYVLLMSVDPGFSGQPFYRQTYRRLEELCALRKRTQPELQIMVDGGIDFENGPACARAGADILIGGAFVCFGQAEGIRKASARFVTALEGIRAEN